MMKVLGYTRVSTKQQGASGLSLEYQEAKIRCYCSINNLDLIDIISDVKGASDLHRNGIHQIFKAVKEDSSIKAIVVLSIDRLTRSTEDYKLLEQFIFNDDLGVTLHLVEGASLALSMLDRLKASEIEVGVIKDRTKKALAVKRAKGEPVGRAPYGYKYKDKELIENADEQAVVNKIKQFRAYGYTLEEIIEKLYECKIYTRGAYDAKFSLALIHKLTKGIKRGSKKEPPQNTKDGQMELDF